MTYLPHPFRLCLAAVFGVAMTTFAAHAQDRKVDTDQDQNQDQNQGGAFLLQWDNDKVVDTDRHYTNGMRLAYTFAKADEQLAQTNRGLAEVFKFPALNQLRTGVVLGQDMYTPENVDTHTPDPLDRPYAGWLYAGLSGQRETKSRQDTYELDLGVIGPAARAGQVQNAFHRLINVSVSRGWRSQIHNELGLLLTRTVKLRREERPLWLMENLNYDAIGHTTAQVGNVRTGASVGGTLRIGQNLGGDFGPVYGTFALPHKRPKELTWSVFAGGEARAVVWDVFLDGNTFKDSPGVNKNPYVFEGRVGLSMHVPWTASSATLGTTGARFSISMVHRTREFTTQDKADRYGSAQLTLNF